MGLSISTERYENDTLGIKPVSIKDFRLSEILGKGSFGLVRVAKHKGTNIKYAVKIIRKSANCNSKFNKRAVLERNILKRLNSPFICPLKYAFQDKNNVYIVLEYMKGKNLRYHIVNRNFTEEQAKFVFMEVACGIHYLHQNKIIHRDIKPENILFNESGHVKIIDFNISISCNEKSSLEGMAGSTVYMAPEILSRNEYDESVDWWSLGVTVYEMIFQKVPFPGRSAEEVLDSINSGVRFPGVTDMDYSKISDSCVGFFIYLLDPCKEIRLGAGEDIRGLGSIQLSRWFKTEDWDSIKAQTSNPPFVPERTGYKLRADHVKKYFMQNGLLSETDEVDTSQSDAYTLDACKVLMYKTKRASPYIKSFTVYDYRYDRSKSTPVGVF